MGSIGSAWTPVPPRPSCSCQLAKNLQALSSTGAWDGQALKAACPFIFSLALDQGPFPTNCRLHSTVQAFFSYIYTAQSTRLRRNCFQPLLWGYKVEVQGQAEGIRGDEGEKAILLPPTHVLKPER